ncbi:hypothetical protein [Actinoallomurus sp. CA-150999]|uniref:hypothetical protein n=1 Tax=Actinoallomurus sp. CA-150999 TaxID=3239887 RepID=UPI003D8B2D71
MGWRKNKDTGRPASGVQSGSGGQYSGPRSGHVHEFSHESAPDKKGVITWTCDCGDFIQSK